jgi:putative tryptophan/tyrosine transport system substrate-binding protein
MDRRALLGVLGLLAAPPAADAQPAAKIPRIGFLQPGPSLPGRLEAFRQGLRELGYVEGKNVIIEVRVAREPKEHAALLAQLVNRNVDVLVTWTTPAAVAATRATSSIPIVAMTGDPVRTRLAASLARPKGNVTGIAIIVDELELKRLQLLREAIPTVSRIAVMWNADNPVWVGVVQRLREVTPTLGVTLQELPVKDSRHFEGALRSATAVGVGALMLVDDIVFGGHSKTLLDLVAKYRLPAMYSQSHFIDAGGLLSYSVNNFDMLRRLAGHVDKILRGARPGDLPIEQPTKFELVINLKTAKALGLTIPPSLLARADRVIE